MIILEGTESREKLLQRYVNGLDTELDYELNQRVNGDGIYVGYRRLLDFYKGRQWTFQGEENQTMRSYNYCFVVVENMTAFLAAEEPEVSHEPIDVTNDLERVVSEKLTQYLDQVHNYNQLGITFQRGARIGSIFGDTYLLGPYWNPDTGQITYNVAENPELIEPIWATEDFQIIDAYVARYRMSIVRARQVFKRQLEERGITLKDDIIGNKRGFAGWEKTGRSGMRIRNELTHQPMVNIKEYLDDKEYLLQIGDELVDYVEHKWNFVPCQHIPNIHLPGEPKGTSDLENLLDPQQEYNIASSGEKDILDAVGFPILWGNEIEGMSEIKTGRGVVFNMPEKARLEAIQVTGNPSVVENYSTRRRDDLIALSRQNDVVVGGGNKTAQLSGRAMAVLMQGINNSVNLRKPYWKNALETLNANILKLSERYVKGADELIRGNYNNTTYISSAYMRSIVDELNKYTHKTQSLQTTMKNIGIASPSDEIKLIKKELEDPVINIETSRQPGLLRQWMKEDQAAAAQAQNPQPAQMTEGDNQGGESPAPAPGQASPSSASGQVNQQTQQTTGAPILEGMGEETS